MLINAPPGDLAAGDRGLAALPGREHEFAASVVTAFAYAQTLGCPRVHFLAGVLAEGADASNVPAIGRRSCAICVSPRAKRGAGRHLTIEPINPRDMPGYFLTQQADAHAIREEAGMPNLKVQMDLYHAQIVEGDLSHKLRRWLPQIAHIQIAGVPDVTSPISARSTSAICSSCSTSWATPAGSAANTARAQARRRGWLDKGRCASGIGTSRDQSATLIPPSMTIICPLM